MTNAARGEVVLEIGGRPCVLCLTMGALAELEAAFGAADPAALGARLKSLSGEDLRVVLGALLRGGGADAGACDLDGVDWGAAAKAAADCFRAAFA